MAPRKTGAYLNDLWGVGAAHALYKHEGHWYHRLERFPGALFDSNGYVLFATEEDYRGSRHISIGKHVHVPKPGISAIPGYVRVVPSGGVPDSLSAQRGVDVGKEKVSYDASLRDRLRVVIDEINSRAVAHRIGALQVIRRDLRGKRRLPARAIFSRQTTRDKYAFHHGGRRELQFNVGIETVGGATYFRHGVAFSFEPSQTLPAIDVLIPKVLRFNEFMKIYPDLLGDFRMWHYERDTRSAEHLPAPIAPELIRPHVFVCLGAMQRIESVDTGLILSDFDRLLPLYEFVEGNAAFPVIEKVPVGFTFKPGYSVRRKSTVANLPARVLDVQLRHNEVQEALYKLLARQYGKENVRAEHPTSNGVRVDVALKINSEYWFFEIKTGFSARACIREALAQLLEYAYWPGAQEASRLIVVGEPPLDAEAAMYLERLRSRFALPIDYQQLDLEQGILKGNPAR